MNAPKKLKNSETFMSWLSAEIAQRMVEKLSLVRITPAQVLIMDTFSPQSLKLLKKLYKNVRLLAVVGLKLHIFERLGAFLGLGVPQHRVIKRQNSQQLLLKDGQVELVWANTWQFQHQEEWQKSLKEWRRVLKTEGVLMFSYLGPDTGQEIRNLSNPTKLWGVDMHDMGDALVGAGFGDPVMDMEYLTLTYENKQLFLNDVAALNLLDISALNLQDQAMIDQLKDSEGLWRLTLELVYGHAWVVNRAVSGVATIKPEDIIRKSK